MKSSLPMPTFSNSLEWPGYSICRASRDKRMERKRSEMIRCADHRTPVTLVTGYLGAGKTTLINHVLSERRGRRIAVIENELAEIGIDKELVIGEDGCTFEMNDGCICCSTHGDLAAALAGLARRSNDFDHVLIEATGIADPRRVAQTFFVDERVRAHFRLDGIVSLVDSMHFWRHVESSHELNVQLKFADLIVLNKTDLVHEQSIRTLQRRVHRVNSDARVIPAKHAKVDINAVLNTDGFDIDRAIDIEPKFMDGQNQFEYAGLYYILEGTYYLTVGVCGEPVEAALIRASGASDDSFDVACMEASLVLALPRKTASSNRPVYPGLTLWRLASSTPFPCFRVAVPTTGHYVLCTRFDTSRLQIRTCPNGEALSPLAVREPKPPYTHDESVTAVSIDVRGDLDLRRLQRWLECLLSRRGGDIFRMKGVLSVDGYNHRFVLQGVHMLLECKQGRSWGNEERKNALVFMGRNLDRTRLTNGFIRCLT